MDYDETFAPVARLEAIRLFIAYATHKGFKLYQMDVKTAFQNELLNDEVFVEQMPGFEEASQPNHVYKLYKTMYRLMQAPRACFKVAFCWIARPWQVHIQGSGLRKQAMYNKEY